MAGSVSRPSMNDTEKSVPSQANKNVARKQSARIWRLVGWLDFVLIHWRFTFTWPSFSGCCTWLLNGHGGILQASETITLNDDETRNYD
jgi:hypothetical protein